MIVSNDDRHHPLVSDRSPNYESARREHMHPSPAPDAELVAALAELVEVELDLAAALRAAADVAESGELAERCQRWSDRHRASLAALSDHLRALGAAPPEMGDDFPSPLPHPADVMGSVAGDDQLERQLADNAAAARAHYQAVMNRTDLPADTRVVVARQLEAVSDARRG